MTAVSQYESMNTTDSHHEFSLWSAYITVAENTARLWIEYRDAWRYHVISDVPYSACEEILKRLDESREKEKEAYLAWKRFTYPKHGFPAVHEDEQSS